ncbi:MAG: aminopeptidase [Eubacteriales bacterium]|nr:aminopeptidase [Eubacteriales bacterium]
MELKGDKKNNVDEIKGKYTKKQANDLKKKLFAEYRNIWETAGTEEREAAFAFADEYKSFLDMGKTERECVILSVEAFEEIGFSDIDSVKVLKPGMKVYKSIKGKGFIAAVLGKNPISEGMNILGAHIDSPRLDLKPSPVYEDSEMVFLKTHYYGGIKKYQWVAIPLAIHGIVVRKDGSVLTVSIGDKEDDPVFTVTDLLPHLGQEQMTKKATEVIKGEDLNVLIGGIPLDNDDVSQKYKLSVLNILNETYGITEKDLVSAEIEIVPAYKAKDVGLDRSFIGAYGQDDRVCAFTALAAIADQEKPDKTVVCILTDKEEIGSEGNSSAQSKLYENFLVEIYSKSNGSYDELGYRKCIAASRMLSADVTNGFDPTFASVSDPKNASYCGKGICLEKYTGSRGKSGASDANSEFFASVVRILDSKNIPWQTGELGKIDAGGGGTICKFMANMGMEVLDCGVAVLAMHSPFEVTSKIDVYYTYLAYKAFIENA